MSFEMSDETFPTSGADVATSVSSEAQSTAFTAESAFRFRATEKPYKMRDKVTINKVMYMIHWGRSTGYGYLPESVDPKQTMKKGAMRFWAVVTPLEGGESTTTNLTMECCACDGRSYFHYGAGKGPTCDPNIWFDFCEEEPQTTGGVFKTFEGETGNHMKSLMSDFINRGKPVGSESLPDYWNETRVQEIIGHAVGESIKELCP